jgi:hypothetical protein
MDVIHAGKIQHHPAVEGNGLPVISGSCAANGDGQVSGVSVAKNALYVAGVEWLYY